MNLSVQDSVGELFESNFSGTFRLDAYHDSQRVDITFLATGTKLTVKADKVKSGSIKDRNLPNIHGVGYVGYGIHKTREKGKNSRSYNAWLHMLERCYSTEYHETKPTYSDCSVCPSWHNFQNFSEWYVTYEIKDFHLDKDIKVKGNRVYSPETCLFVSSTANTQAAHQKVYKFVSPEGIITEITNLASFCREKGLSDKNMSLVYFGKRTHCEGWVKYDSVNTKLNSTIARVAHWHEARNLIDGSTDAAQFTKLLEEVDELRGFIEGDGSNFKDHVGDILVVLINHCIRNNTTLEECLEVAYEDIKDRKGRMVDGVFIKEITDE
jgi:NTP pyrophosphatase (non-canonical NTP hydrolase)